MIVSRRHRGVAVPARERGETLLELMATVIVMSLAVVAVLTMIFTAVRVSRSYRETTSANTEALNFAEDLLQTGNGQLYTDCAGVDDYSYSSPVGGYEATVVGIEYLADRNADTLAWVEVCPAQDQGLQRVQVRVTSPGDPAQTEDLVVFKRDRTCADGTGERC